MMPCGFPSLRQRWIRCDRPRRFCNVTTLDPSCTGPRPTRRQPYPTTDPATSGLSSSQGGGDELTTEAAGGGSAGGRTALRPSPPCAGSLVSAGTARADETPVRAALTATAAAAPTAALPINSRRESIVHSLLRSRRPHGRDAELVLLERLQRLGAELVVHVHRRHRHVLRHPLRRLGEIADEIRIRIRHRPAALADRRAEVPHLLHVEQARRRPELIGHHHLHALREDRRPAGD